MDTTSSNSSYVSSDVAYYFGKAEEAQRAIQAAKEARMAYVHSLCVGLHQSVDSNGNLCLLDGEGNVALGRTSAVAELPAEADDTFVSSLEEPPAKRRKVCADSNDAEDGDVAALTSSFAAMSMASAKIPRGPRIVKHNVVYSLVEQGLPAILTEIEDGVRVSIRPSMSWASGKKYNPYAKHPHRIIHFFMFNGPMNLDTAVQQWTHSCATLTAVGFKDHLRELVKQGIIVATPF